VGGDLILKIDVLPPFPSARPIFNIVTKLIQTFLRFGEECYVYLKPSIRSHKQFKLFFSRERKLLGTLFMALPWKIQKTQNTGSKEMKVTA